jgi:two-component system sensor histidine kinase BaeS
VKLSIRYRIFLAMLAATAVVVLSMFLIAQWSFNRGFLQYVNTLEQERLDTLAQELVQEYADQGNWNFLRNEPVNWLRLMIRTLPPGILPPEQLQRLERRMERRAMRGEPPPREAQPGLAHRFELRVVLLDAAHQPVFGPAQGLGNSPLIPLQYQDKTIGYLGLAAPPKPLDLHQLRFVKQQTLALALIAGISLLVSVLLTLPLAKRLVRPIRALAAATHKLTTGEFATRVPEASGDELGQLARDFNLLALTLEKNQQARRQWVADISHELRTPLAVLRGEIEALQDGVRQATSEAIGSLHAEVLQLGRLVDDLYQLALSDLGALNYRKQNLDLNPLLQTVLESYRAPFAAKGIRLEFQDTEEPLELSADPERLHQLFTNLLANSLRYTDAGGRLEIGVKKAGNYAALDFCDSHPGVPATELEHLFERLYRGEASRNRALGGAGLGLAICRNIVEAHGGRIEARPSPLGGVWIHVELPLTGEVG